MLMDYVCLPEIFAEDGLDLMYAFGAGGAVHASSQPLHRTIACSLISSNWSRLREHCFLGHIFWTLFA